MVGLFGEMSGFKGKCIVVGASIGQRRQKTITDFYCFYSAHGHDTLGKLGVQFVKYRFAEPDRKSGHTTLNNSTAGIFLRHHLVEIFSGCFGQCIVWHIKRIF